VSAVTPIHEIEAGRSILGRDQMGLLAPLGRTRTVGGTGPIGVPSPSGFLPGSLFVPATAATGSVAVLNPLEAPSGLYVLATGTTCPIAVLNSHGALSGDMSGGTVKPDVGSFFLAFALAANSSGTKGWVMVGGTPGASGVTMVSEGFSCSAWTVCTSATIEIARTALATCSELLQSRRGLLRPHEVSALERQLTSLLSDHDEIAESGLTVSTASLDGLIAFLSAHRPNMHPRLSLTRSGLFAASWSPHGRAKLTLTFTHDAAEWVGVDLAALPPVRGNAAIVIGSLAGMRQPFRGWITA
jgi:hypothetical protein